MSRTLKSKVSVGLGVGFLSRGLEGSESSKKIFEKGRTPSDVCSDRLFYKIKRFIVCTRDFRNIFGEFVNIFVNL